MADKKPVHDLRDDSFVPRTSVTDLDERLVGAEPGAVNPEKGDMHLVRPEPGKNVPDGQTTKQ